MTNFLKEPCANNIPFPPTSMRSCLGKLFRSYYIRLRMCAATPTIEKNWAAREFDQRNERFEEYVCLQLTASLFSRFNNFEECCNSIYRGFQRKPVAEN